MQPVFVCTGAHMYCLSGVAIEPTPCADPLFPLPGSWLWVKQESLSSCIDFSPYSSCLATSLTQVREEGLLWGKEPFPSVPDPGSSRVHWKCSSRTPTVYTNAKHQPKICRVCLKATLIPIAEEFVFAAACATHTFSEEMLFSLFQQCFPP